MEFEERYFREELDYLRQLSKLLATEKPHLARFLAEKDADPDIERLLEGVAFLTGNLRQKIEDEFPELTHGLIKMLWPNYLRPVPAMTLIEYTPDMDKSSVPVLIPRNEQFTTNAGEIRVDEVLPSDAKKEEPPPCTFTLCRDIWLLPVRLEQIENRSTTRNGVINITFSVAPGTDFRTLDLNKLRFWLGNDDNYTRNQLYLWFCEYLQGADLTVGEQHIRLPEFMLKAVGFEPQDAMLPWPKNVHSGYQVIVEHADDPETMQEVLYPVLADFFKPALLARMEVVPYLPLSKETLATIIAGKLARLDNVLRSRFGAEVVIEPEVTDEIMSRVTRAENGARMLESVIDGDMLPPLSLLLLQKMAANTAIARIRLSAVDGAFTADVEDALDDESVTEDEPVL
ncbi:type VI secretion system baseplate subunit TssF [Escherichia coli]|uniref:type VI secretion system baseplate subunit TssF n=1 Tax=Escherichia coli TaxID=562 RepID=UPI00374D6971